MVAFTYIWFYNNQSKNKNHCFLTSISLKCKNLNTRMKTAHYRRDWSTTHNNDYDNKIIIGMKLRINLETRFVTEIKKRIRETLVKYKVPFNKTAVTNRAFNAPVDKLKQALATHFIDAELIDDNDINGRIDYSNYIQNFNYNSYE